jgi:hypothetical protein
MSPVDPPRGSLAAPLRSVRIRSAGFSLGEVSFVDGFAGEKYLLEIEATALIKP